MFKQKISTPDKDRVQMLSETLKTVMTPEGKEYDLDNIDDVYLLAYTTAHAIGSRRGMGRTSGHLYPFDANRNDVDVRAVWDMGWEDGFSDGYESNGILNMYDSRIPITKGLA